MIKRLKPTLWVLLVIAAFSVMFPSRAVAAESQVIDRWLLLGPAPIAESEQKILGSHLEMLNFKYIEPTGLNPAPGVRVRWDNTRTLSWGEMKVTTFKGVETGMFFLSTYLEPSRWMKTGLTINNSNMGVTVYLDGKAVKAKVENNTIKAPLVLDNEKHLLVLKILLVKNETFNFKATLTHDNRFSGEKIAISLSPRQKIAPRHILNTAQVSSIHLSPDGKRVGVALSRTDTGSGKPVSWVEVLDTARGKTLFSSRYFGQVSNFSWPGTSSSFTFTRVAGEKTAIFRYDLETREVTPLKSGIENFYTYRWSADGSYMIYSTYSDAEENPTYKHIKEIGDKSEEGGQTFAWTLFFPDGGVTHQLSDENQDFR